MLENGQWIGAINAAAKMVGKSGEELNSDVAKTREDRTLRVRDKNEFKEICGEVFKLG
jgi:hypothetical protein